MTMRTKTRVTANDVMTKEPICVDAGIGIRQLAQLFEEHEISGVPVVSGNGKLIGVVSQTDLIRRCSEGTPDAPPGYLFELLSDEAGEDVELVPEPLIVVGDFMTADPVTVGPDEPAGEVAQRMAEHHIHRIVVVDEESVPIGIITTLDLLKVFPK